MPDTSWAERACSCGALDPSLGQAISFPSLLQLRLRIEVLLWRDLATARHPSGDLPAEEDSASDATGQLSDRPGSRYRCQWGLLNHQKLVLVVRVQGCYQAVAWMQEQVIAVAFWTELSCTGLGPRSSFDWGLRGVRCGAVTLGSTPCGGSVLLTSSSAASISSCAGRVSEEAGGLLRQSPSSAEEVVALSLSSMRASSSSGCTALGMVGDSEEELWTETASLASSSCPCCRRLSLRLEADRK